jgi:hypothetical protein
VSSHSDISSESESESDFGSDSDSESESTKVRLTHARPRDSQFRAEVTLHPEHAHPLLCYRCPSDNKEHFFLARRSVDVIYPTRIIVDVNLNPPKGVTNF